MHTAGDAETRPAGRSVLVAVAVGIVVALVTFAVVFGIVAIPFFALARFAEGESGLGRPSVRDNLLTWTLPVSLVAGLVAGAVVGRWYRRGGRLPDTRE
jgi:O-antigen/teichoic acid export membrane protein